MDTSPEQSSPPLLRPVARRPFQQRSLSSNTPSPNEGTPSQPSTPRIGGELEEAIDSKNEEMSRTRSIMNLTSSTLFGIYAPSSFNDASQSPTPWGTGAETPMRHGSVDELSTYGGGPRGSEIEARLLGNKTSSGRTSPSQQHYAPQSPVLIILRTILRVVVLFSFGLVYGGLIAHLHDNRNVAPVRVEGLNRGSWRYFVFWGLAGVAMGSLLPWIDGMKIRKLEDTSSRTQADRPVTGLNNVQWNDVVRSVGAFVGVAFAIRRLPWSSPLQLTLTLALVNPFLWYLIDRTPAGFTLSTLFGALGTASILFINPNLVPSTSESVPTSKWGTSASYNHSAGAAEGDSTLVGGLLRFESLGVATWIASVLFCACVCFGSIGRLLVPSSPPPLANSIGKRRAAR